MPSTEGPSALLAYVRDETAHGPVGLILEVTGAFADEVSNGGLDLEDHGLPHVGPARGLLVFEGWIDVGVGPEPDVHWQGGWRALDHWELCQLRFGRPLFHWKEKDVKA